MAVQFLQRDFSPAAWPGAPGDWRRSIDRSDGWISREVGVRVRRQPIKSHLLAAYGAGA